MFFINPSMFTGDIHIPNLDESCIKDYEIFKLITKWEKECLQFVLGKCLFEQLIDQIEIKTDEKGNKYYALKDDADQKWQWLVNGRKYSKEDDFVTDFEDLSLCGCGCSEGNCEFHYWDGFVTKTPLIIEGKEEEFEESFIAYYVYTMWCFFNETRTTGIGEQKPESKNSIGTTNKMKRIDAWNYFYSKVDMCGINGAVGLNGFLREHSELFPDVRISKLKPKNYFDV